MKNYLAIMLLFCLMPLFASGCSNNDKTPATTDAASAKVDVDLTEFSQTMMIAMINNIYATPDDYIDKTIKMRGQYSSEYFSNIGRRFHYVLYIDDESCCSYGFIFENDGTYPDDFPEEGEDIEVSGMFGRGEALNQTYHYLAVDEIR